MRRLAAGNRGHVRRPCRLLLFGPLGLLCGRVLEVVVFKEDPVIIVVIRWNASGRLWLFQTLRLRCAAAAGRRRRRRGAKTLAASGRQLLLRLRRLPCAAAGRCGGAQTLAANGRLWQPLWLLLRQRLSVSLIAELLRRRRKCGLPRAAASRCGGGRLWLLHWHSGLAASGRLWRLR